jgi:hypothetical protein
MLSRIVFLTVLAVTAGCADPGLSPDRQATSGGEGPSDQAHVVCEKDATTLANPVVRAQRDGVHVVIENRDNVWGFEFRDITDPNVATNSGPIGPGTTRFWAAAGPGDVLVACLRPRDQDGEGGWYSDVNAPTARLTIVDPDGLHVPFDLACGWGEQSRVRIAGREREDPYQVYRRIPGIQESDVFKGAHYPNSPQYPGTAIVLRHEVAVARLMFPTFKEEWEILVNTCEGSGIAGTT